MYSYRNLKQLIPLVVLSAALLLLAACGGADQTATPIEIDVTEGIEGTVVVEPEEEPEATETVEPTAEEAETEPAEEPETPAAPATEPAATETAEPAPEGDVGQIGLELVTEGLTSPVVFTPIDDGSGRYLIADQVGLIHVLNADGELLETPFLDVRDRMVTLMEGFDERGLLGLALHPNFADNGRFFVYYSAPLREGAPQEFNHTSHISEFHVSVDDENVADPDSEQILLQVDQPQFNHDGGQILFGPDDYLYIPLGDGGNANDVGEGHVEDWYDVNEGGNGQDRTSNLLGSILRIDVDGEGADGQPYAIPEDNPYVDGQEAFPETWAYGFRNPFRMSFDVGGDNALYVADVGQDRWEEVSIVTAGGNYGWNVKEATHCFSTSNPAEDLEECPDETPDGEPLIDPVIEYQNANQEGGLGLSIIGGYIYRGQALSGFEGQYIFGDWSTQFGQGLGKLFVAMPSDTEGELWPMEELTIADREDGNLNEFLLSIGEDLDGELYILTTETPGPTGETGKVYRLVPAGEAAQGDMEGETEGEDVSMEVPEDAEPTTEVAMQNFAFVPQTNVVQVGDTVTWTNEDNVPHTVTAGTRDAPSDMFDSGQIAPGETFTFTFEEAGAYDYFCSIHSGMAGTVIVEQ